MLDFIMTFGFELKESGNQIILSPFLSVFKRPQNL